MTFLAESEWCGKIYFGEWASGGGEPISVREPATGDELGRLGAAAPEDVGRATVKAAAAQRQWARAGYRRRAAVLRRAGDLWLEHAAEIEAWIVRESGSVRAKARSEIERAADECYEAAALASHPVGEVLRSHVSSLSFSRQVPVGVVGVIAPFNFPVILSIRSVAPALALGNAVVLKPDPRTAVCGGVVLARIFEEAGLPAGVLSMLPGGAAVGEALVADPAVRVVAFTGSTRAGRSVGRLAGAHLKRAHLELGGNSAFIVMPGVDVGRAAEAGAFGSFHHQGQICMATGRHIVADEIADDYVAALAERARKHTVGDPATADVDLGPIIDEVQRDRVHALVTASLDAGADLACGGRYDRLFYAPTVLAGGPASAPAYAQEVFGPVAPVVRYSSPEEAVALAADSEYGLSLGIVTTDGLAALELAQRIPVGKVHINDQTVVDETLSPFGGMGVSGNGPRLGGFRHNADAYTETQWVTARSRLGAGVTAESVK
jgi:benzaldehyde dehydrogenase (NAD)